MTDKCEKFKNHYEYLDKYLPTFWKHVFNHEDCAGMITSHGDKIMQYKKEFEKAGVPFFHGCLMYLLTYSSKMTRPKYESLEWCIENYKNYSEFILSMERNNNI